MKITSIEAFEVDFTPHPKTKPRRPSISQAVTMRKPKDRYQRLRSAGQPPWQGVACVATAEDGTWGLGITIYGSPVVAVINDHFAPNLVGESAMATGRVWDMMVRLTAPYGGTGLASYAISAVDTALWDLKGKILEKPVYELLGGPQKDRIFCYATGYDTEWYLELGFNATKIFTPWGPEDGAEGLRKNEELVSNTRELVGDSAELMLDCWLSMDEEYTVRLAETLRPYRLKWLEDYVTPENYPCYGAIRRRLPWQTLASGEHWYLPTTFNHAITENYVDILQPDVLWAGGITAGVKICQMAEAAGLSVIPHASMNNPYGQHLVYAMSSACWGERSQGVSPPGVPLEEMVYLPGTAVIDDGYLTPSDAPGFGIEVTREWLQERCVSS
jgi:L-rhamnonate dehydratase